MFLALKREQRLCDQSCGLVHMGKPLFSVYLPGYACAEITGKNCDMQ